MLDAFLAGLSTEDACRTVGVTDWIAEQDAETEELDRADPRLGFFAQREKYSATLDSGQVLAPAKNPDQMRDIGTNSTVDGVLAAVFALLVIVDVVRVWANVLRGGGTQTTETPHVESTLSVEPGFRTFGRRRVASGEPGREVGVSGR